MNELLIQLQSFDVPPPGVRFRGWLVDLLNALLPPSVHRGKPRAVPANILVIGATNRAADLDPALLRPGRFDRSIFFGLPSRAGRREIVDYYLAKKAHDAALDDPHVRENLAAMTSGYSPVMIEHLLDEALVWALRRGARALNWADIQKAKMTEEIGVAQPVEYTVAEQRTIATHEAGHATIAWLVGKSRKLEVLSIIKRKEALGLLAHSDLEERFLRSESEMRALVQIALGGLASEELFFGEISSVPASDLVAATTLTAQMIGSLGMDGDLFSFEALEAGAGNLVAKIASVDGGQERMEASLAEAHDKVRVMLAEHRHVVEALRDALLQRDELIGDEILEVIASACSSPEPAGAAEVPPPQPAL